MDLYDIKKIVGQGEGLHLEFKRKANHPEKIAREMVAFANTGGGKLLLGVEDDGRIFGSKHPAEDAWSIRNAIEKYCVPPLHYSERRVAVTGERDVLVLDIPRSKERPHYLHSEDPRTRKIAYVRVRDMSVKASREMVSYLHLSRSKRGVSLRMGEKEQLLMQELEQKGSIRFDEAVEALKMSRRRVSRLLVLFARSGLIRIQPEEGGDLFELAEEAFQ